MATLVSAADYTSRPTVTRVRLCREHSRMPWAPGRQSSRLRTGTLLELLNDGRGALVPFEDPSRYRNCPQLSSWMTMRPVRQCADALTSMHVRWSGTVQRDPICELSHELVSIAVHPHHLPLRLGFSVQAVEKSAASRSPQMPEHDPPRLRQVGRAQGHSPPEAVCNKHAAERKRNWRISMTLGGKETLMCRTEGRLRTGTPIVA